jgi:hypothetical protein
MRLHPDFSGFIKSLNALKEEKPQPAPKPKKRPCPWKKPIRP